MTSKHINNIVAAKLRGQKKEWANLEDPSPEPKWVTIKKKVLLEISITYQDIIQKNVLLVLNYDLLNLDLNDTYYKSYSG